MQFLTNYFKTKNGGHRYGSLSCSLCLCALWFLCNRCPRSL
ncbi:hypothetical protein G8B50_12430 [Enterococcus durans]|nr:hypothetical protein [Enterococcus durans]